MSRAPVRDLLVGLFILAGLGAVAYLSLSVGGVSYGGPRHMALYADFDETGGLKPRAQVVIAGVKVGQVASITLDQGYRAHVRVDVDAALKLPIDTTASIMTAGLLGDRYVSLQVGGSDVGRFAVNSTVGVLGLFDPASGWGLVKHDEDFGQTLGVWGVPPGAYLVLPLLGPSGPRDAAGFAVDYALSVTPFFIDEAILWGAQVGDTVNERSFVLKQVEDAKASAFDYYAFVRNAYLQRRRALVRDLAEGSAEESEELYHLEFDLEEKP